MAIFHLSAKAPISRAAGRSATAAAAYRAGVRIVDARTALVYDYSRKRGVIACHLMLPGGESPPDREAFWNAVEMHHKRGDAVIAREIVIALPCELPPEERESLARRFAREIADKYEVAVDCALHMPSRTGDQRNFHAHLLLSACTVSADGTLGRKSAALDPIYCRRNGTPDSVAWLRPRWEHLGNEALSRVGSQHRIDHRSNAARGLQRAPSLHIGRGASARQRKRLNMHRQALNAALRRNAVAMSQLLDEQRVLRHERAPAPKRAKRRPST